MDTTQLLMAIPAVLAIIASLAAGGMTAMRMLTAAAKIVATLAQAELSNADKRKAALDQLYAQFPVAARFVPVGALAQIVEQAWQEIVKPVIAMPLPPAPPKDAKPADPAK